MASWLSHRDTRCSSAASSLSVELVLRPTHGGLSVEAYWPHHTYPPVKQDGGIEATMVDLMPCDQLYELIKLAWEATLAELDVPNYTSSQAGNAPVLAEFKESLLRSYWCVNFTEYAIAPLIDLDPLYDPHLQTTYIAWVYTWGHAEERPRKSKNRSA